MVEAAEAPLLLPLTVRDAISEKAETSGPKAPAGGGMAETQDPNYQTLAGIGGDCFEKKG